MIWLAIASPAFALDTNAVIDAIIGARPATAKGRLLTSGAVSATMSPGVKVDVNPFEKL